MRNELLNYLKSSVDRNWLQVYPELNSSQELYRQTQDRLQQILSFEKESTKLAIFIVEKEPVKFLAAYLAGVIAEVNIFLCDPAWQRQEWKQVLQSIEPDLVYCDRAIKELIKEVKLAKKNSAAEQSKLPNSPLIMIPTGGTSGKICFAIHSWETLAASVTGFKDYFDCSKINSFCCLPLYHVSGLMQFMRSLITGGNLIIGSYKKVATRQFTFDLQNFFISLVPTQLQHLIETVPNWLTEFKIVLLGGASAGRSLLATARRYNIPVALTYGMTETASGIVTLKPKDFLAGNSSNGKVLPHAKVKISQTETINDKIGAIAISSSSLCKGYYPELFAPGQPFVTDDLGYFDERGYLYLVGRNSQKIITGGENVFPAEVESAIYATKLVKDVCVMGMSDRRWGQAVTAFYVPVEMSNNLSSIQQKLRSLLSNYKQPKTWIKVNKIPRNNRGKINYQKLQAIAEERHIP